MKFWKEIVNNASLGTAKAPVKWSSLPSFLQEPVAAPNTPDSEEEFLTIASLTYQYRLGGFLAPAMDHKAIANALPETQSYTSAAATSIFKLIFTEELPALTGLWVELCKSKNQIAEPDILTDLLDLGVKRKEFRPYVKAITGKRGEWLANLNPEWIIYVTTENTEELWQTGTPEQRKALVKDFHSIDPAKAIALLKSTWDTEGANEKAAFLELLRNNLSPAELEWLESLKEKSLKVTAVIQDLLKSIPGSTVVERFWIILKDHVRLKSGKALLGMINRTTIEVDDNITFPDDIFKTEIEKLSSDKNVSDNQHVLHQLISAIPPSYWDKYFNEESKTIVELFQKEKETAPYITAIAQAAIRFNDATWLEVILDNTKMDLIKNLLPLMIKALPHPKKQEYAVKFFTEKPHELIDVMTQQNEEWSIALTKAILKFTAGEIYAYNKNFYRQAVAFIPIAILSELESLAPSEDLKRTYWANQSEELKRLLELKKQIIQSF